MDAEPVDELVDPPWLADAPLVQAWRSFVDGDPTPFTIPGHKRRAGRLGPTLEALLHADVPLYGGADTVKLTAGVLAGAEQRAAALWGADWCRFSVGGSTHANQAACLAVGRPGDTVLVARNAHRSTVSGLVLAGLRPVWLAPAVDDATGLVGGLPVATVAHALTAHPEAVALFCVEPSYVGTLSDLAAIVTNAHATGVAVVVDQAWGAHLGFAPHYPAHAIAVGADLVVTSAHKALPAFSQASLLLARLDPARIDAGRLDRAFEAGHTTSPSAAVLASIDAVRALLASSAGPLLLTQTADLVAAARHDLRVAGLDAPSPDDFPAGRFDPAKLVVSFARSGHDGIAVERMLLAAGVPVEMADRDTVVAIVGLLDDADTLGRLTAGILEAVRRPPGPPRGGAATPPPIPPQRLTPREAFFAPHEAVTRRHALGRVAAELVAPYPPGVPVLVPGEEITEATLDTLDRAVAAGTRIAYAADATLASFQVVR